jgi:hypothetical protein
MAVEWPNPKFINKRKLELALQIQYFVKGEDGNSETIQIIAVNLLVAKAAPYDWHRVPCSLEPIIRIVLWIQWVLADLYLSGLVKGPLLGQYIIYMEEVIDKLWDALSSGKLKDWEVRIGSKWVQKQKFLGGRHSRDWEEKQTRSDNGLVQRLGLALEDWEEEARTIEENGFPGSQLYRMTGRVDQLSSGERDAVMEEMKKLLEGEAWFGKF